MKYLLHEADADEKHQVEAWIAASDSNKTYFLGLKKVWDSSQQLAASSTVDEDKAWQRFVQRRDQPQHTAVMPAKQAGRFGASWLRIAAAIILLVGLGWVTYNIVSPQAKVREIMVQAGVSALHDTLPDGTTVTLNKASSISYPSAFKGTTRPVQLKGEAFFQVTPNKKKPFIIDVNDVTVTVVGTSFNIKSHQGKTEVVVETGIVRVTKGGTTIELKANEKIVIGEKNNIVAQKEDVNDKLYNYYRTKEFVCDDTPLSKLVEVLNEAYATRIVFGNEKLKNLRMNATFNNESLEQVLQVIKLTFNVKITQRGDEYIIE